MEHFPVANEPFVKKMDHSSERYELINPIKSFMYAMWDEGYLLRVLHQQGEPRLLAEHAVLQL